MNDVNYQAAFESALKQHAKLSEVRYAAWMTEQLARRNKLRVRQASLTADLAKVNAELEQVAAMIERFRVGDWSDVPVLEVKTGKDDEKDAKP